MGTEEIINKTKGYFCFGIEHDDLAVRIDYARLLGMGELIVDFGTGEGRSAITMAMANPDIEVFTFDCGRNDLTNEELEKRTLDRMDEQGVRNVKFKLEDAKTVYPEWDRKIAGLTIDAEGSYQDTKAEIERWFPFVKSGGRIFMQSYNLIDKYPGIRQSVDEYLESHKEYELGGLYHNTKVIDKL